MGRRRLIIFTRYPEPGKVKTRLIPALGEEGAANLHKKMTEHSVAWAASLSERMPDLLEIRYEGKDQNLMAEWLGSGYSYQTQGGGDLGEKMARAFEENFQKKKKNIVLVGTDCPQMSAFHVKAAFDALKTHDLVLGRMEGTV
jgi:rSAM/selenodomain-associated transferase 1